jgi:hypothetical protein
MKRARHLTFAQLASIVDELQDMLFLEEGAYDPDKEIRSSCDVVDQVHETLSLYGLAPRRVTPESALPLADLPQEQPSALACVPWHEAHAGLPGPDIEKVLVSLPGQDAQVLSVRSLTLLASDSSPQGAVMWRKLIPGIDIPRR